MYLSPDYQKGNGHMVPFTYHHYFGAVAALAAPLAKINLRDY